MAAPDRRRAAVVRLQGRFGVSQRRACCVVGQHRSTQRRKRRRLGEGTAARLRAEHPDHVWALDFRFDETAQHRCLKLPGVIDEFTREALAIHVDHSIDADRVVEVVERIAAQRGAPRRLRMDNGPEPAADALRDSCRTCRTCTAYIEPGAPWENGWIESFNGRLRDECHQHRGLRQPPRSPRRHRGLAQRLQPLPAPPSTRRADPRRLRC